MLDQLYNLIVLVVFVYLTFVPTKDLVAAVELNVTFLFTGRIVKASEAFEVDS